MMLIHLKNYLIFFIFTEHFLDKSLNIFGGLLLHEEGFDNGCFSHFIVYGSVLI